MQRITQEELSALIMDNKDGMYRLAFSILRNDADAQDAVSEAIVLAFEKSHQLRKTSSAKSWLMQILVNSSKKIALQSNKYVLLENEIQYEQAEEYESNGVYPEESILEIKDSSQIDSSRICFEPDTSTFYLPERELTDEEMLELIDFYNIRDNVLSGQKTEAAYDMTGVDEITEEEAKSIAKDLLQKLYGADTDNMKVEVDYQQGTDGEESFSTDYLYFTDEETGEQYEVSVDLQNAKAGSVAKIAAESPYEDNLKPDEALYKRQYETADKMASAFIGNTEEWKDSKITYLVSDDGSVRNGVVNYEFTAQSGECCIVSYSQSLGQMYKVRYFTEAVNIYTDCFSGYNIKEIR